MKLFEGLLGELVRRIDQGWLVELVSRVGRRGSLGGLLRRVGEEGWSVGLLRIVGG